MQLEAWMTQISFSNWITHFVNCLSTRKGISCERRHLLIVDGHNSHITLEVVMKAMDVGLDLLTLPSHTTHCLQPLDVNIFSPFKKYFRRYRDAWIMKNRGKGACKEILAMWMSLGLQRALTKSNIEVAFYGISIWPLNPRMVEKYLGPTRPFQPAESEGIIYGVESIVDVDAVSRATADGIASGVGDLRGTSQGTRWSYDGQLSRNTCVAGSSTRFVGSPTIGEPLDLGEADKGSDEMLDILLDRQLLEPHLGRHHYVLRQGKVCKSLEHRSTYTSSASGSDSEGLQNPAPTNADATDGTRAAWGRSSCPSIKGLKFSTCFLNCLHSRASGDTVNAVRLWWIT